MFQLSGLPVGNRNSVAYHHKKKKEKIREQNSAPDFFIVYPVNGVSSMMPFHPINVLLFWRRVFYPAF